MLATAMDDTPSPTPPSPISSFEHWPDLAAAARSVADDRRIVIPEWAWALVAECPLPAQQATAALIFDLARVFVEHGTGKPEGR